MNTVDKEKLVQVLGSDYGKILEASHDGVVIIDKEGIIVYCNELWVSVCAFDQYGYTKEKIEGMNLHFFIDSGLGIRAVALEVLVEKKKQTAISYSLDKKVILTTASPIFDIDGQLAYVAAFVSDESEIYRLKADVENAQEIRSMYIDYINSIRQQQEENSPIIESPVMREIFSKALQISDTNVTVLISGESGVGKDVLAKFIHTHSSRVDKPFIAVNCGAIPENLVESEFFGYVSGSFTGANKSGKLGIFEVASSGTLFLDELGELPLNIQVKLLRALETRSITRVGSTEAVPIDVRIIAATNQHLEEKIYDGSFRSDLYYRINVINLEIPPLRTRPEDITALSRKYLEQFNRIYKKNKHFDDRILALLTGYSWPGNVRELRNVIEQLVLISTKDLVDAELLENIIVRETSRFKTHNVTVRYVAPLNEVVAEAEEQLLLLASRSKNTSRDIAELLQVDQTTVSRKLKKYGIHYKL